MDATEVSGELIWSHIPQSWFLTVPVLACGKAGPGLAPLTALLLTWIHTQTTLQMREMALTLRNWKSCFMSTVDSQLSCVSFAVHPWASASWTPLIEPQDPVQSKNVSCLEIITMVNIAVPSRGPYCGNLCAFRGQICEVNPWFRIILVHSWCTILYALINRLEYQDYFIIFFYSWLWVYYSYPYATVKVTETK